MLDYVRNDLFKAGAAVVQLHTTISRTSRKMLSVVDNRYNVVKRERVRV
jgi:hypothetical protein